MIRILVLNYGGTSAKLAVFEDKKCVNELSITYTEEESNRARTAGEDVAYKTKVILDWLREIGLTPDDFDAFAPRLGATFYGGDGGTFLVEGALRKQVESKYVPDKPIFHAIFETIGIVNELQKLASEDKPIFTTDPASVDQFLPEAKITGYPGIQKRASFHALNQRAAARKAAAEMGKDYKDVNLIVAHIGGGVSVGAHEKGRIIDSNDSTGDADGPFSSTRAGSIPAGPIVHICYSGKYTEAEMLRMLRDKSGLQGYLGTSDLREVEKRIDEGDRDAETVYKALAYQISREIASCYATLCGEVDGIVITAGMAYSRRLINLITSRIGKLGTIYCYPGGMEDEALALGAYRAMTGEEALSTYDPKDEYKNIGVVSAK